MEWIALVLIGLAAGSMSGMLGIGGGIIIVPLLVYFMKYPQIAAQGTSLAALTPPVAFVAAYQYYQRGNVNVTHAVLIVCGFVVGSYLTSSIIHKVPEVMLKRCFAMLLMFVAGQMIFATLGKGGGSLLPWLGGGGAAFALGALSKKKPSDNAPRKPEAPVG